MLKLDITGHDVGHTDLETDPEDYDLYGLLDTEVNSTRFYMLVLYGLARSYQWKAMLELGCFRGNTTCLLARAAKKNNGHVWAVDCDFEGPSIRMTHEHLERVGLLEYVTLVQTESWDPTPELPLEVDFVFIDAYHTYDGISRDWNTWSPKVKQGGIVACHDMNDGELRRWAEEVLPMEGWEHILFPPDCGLMLMRRVNV